MESSVQKTRKVLEYLLHKFYDGADGYPHARLNIRDKGMIKAAQIVLNVARAMIMFEVVA